MGQWLVLTDIFVSTAHHAVHTHFLSEGVGVGVAEAVLAGLVLSVVLGAWGWFHDGEGVVGVPVVRGVGVGGGESCRGSLGGDQGEGDKDGN